MKIKSNFKQAIASMQLQKIFSPHLVWFRSTVEVDQKFRYSSSAESLLPPHRGFKWLKPAKKNYLQWFHEFFQNRFQQIHLISVSSHCKRFIFKMCRNDVAIRITSQFHKFLNLIFGGFFVIGNLCVPPRPRSLHQRFITISLVGLPKLKVKVILCTQLLGVKHSESKCTF